MCYPFGTYNDITLKLMHEQDVDYCLSTSPGPPASSPGFSFLALPRWDTMTFGMITLEDLSFLLELRHVSIRRISHKFESLLY